MVPLARSTLQACSPSQVSGTLTAMFPEIAASSRPSAIIASASVAVTSALTGPSIASQISVKTSNKGRPVFAIRDGFVVTPSRSPVTASSRISPMSAVSIKNFIEYPFLDGLWLRPLSERH